MYEYLSGTLKEKTPTFVVLEVHGVGYRVHVPLSTFSDLPAAGEKAQLFTHFVVKEDAHALYGFRTEEERELFRRLIGITGIGPKLGMTLLSGLALEDLKHAIVKGALPVLTGIPGIGRKMAERIVIELREKLIVEEKQLPRPSSACLPGQDGVFEDSLRALLELGYRKPAAKEALQKALKERPENNTLTVPDLIRASLKYV